MAQRADAELIGYLADNYDQARLVLRGVSDVDAALVALEKAAAAVWRIPSPVEPSAGLPNLCEASLEDGLPVLHMDAKDGADHIDLIAAALLKAIDAEGVGGRLEPFPLPDPPSGGTGRHRAAVAVETQVHPRAREIFPGDLGLAVSEYGFLYSEGVRAMLGPLLDPWALVGYETCFAMHATREAATEFGRRMRGAHPSGELPRLWPLREHRSGMTLAELCAQMGAPYEELAPVLDETERIGELTRWQSHDGSKMLGLTDRGQFAMDGHLRRKAEKDLVVLEDVPPEQLTLLRHVCVQVVANIKQFGRRDEDEASDSAVSDSSRWRLGLENERLYVVGMRAFTHPLEPRLVLGLEALHALHSAASALPRELPRALATDGRTLTAWWLHARPEGMPRSVITDALGREGAQVLDELEQGGIVTRGAATVYAVADAASTYFLTEGARALMSERVQKLEEDMRATFDGLSIEHLGGVRDGCWRIALNLLGAGA